MIYDSSACPLLVPLSTCPVVQIRSDIGLQMHESPENLGTIVHRGWWVHFFFFFFLSRIHSASVSQVNLLMKRMLKSHWAAIYKIILGILWNYSSTGRDFWGFQKIFIISFWALLTYCPTIGNWLLQRQLCSGGKLDMSNRNNTWAYLWI